MTPNRSAAVAQARRRRSSVIDVGRVAVCSIMYLGDVAPFLAVASELGARGHDVVGIFPEGFRPLAEGEPFAFHPYALDASPERLHADREHQRIVQHPF